MGCAPSVESTAEYSFPVLDRARKRPQIRAREPEAFRSCKVPPKCARKKQGSRAEIRDRFFPWSHRHGRVARNQVGVDYAGSYAGGQKEGTSVLSLHSTGVAPRTEGPP